MSTNTKLLYIYPTSSFSTGSGHEVAAGESVTLEIDTTSGIYVLGETAASQNFSVVEVGA